MADEITQKARRPKGKGSISKDENGKYHGRIKVAGYGQFSCTGSTKQEVERKLEDFHKITLKDEVVPQRIFVSDYIENWLENVKKPTLKQSSYDRLEETYKRYIKGTLVAHRQLGNLTAMDVQKLINEKAEYLSYSTLKKIYGLLKECFQYAVVNRQLNFNPLTAVIMPKEQNLKKSTKQMQVFTDDEMKRIEEVAKITYSTGEVRFKHTYLFILLANTGMRVGEAIALTWDNVDLDNRLIYIRQNAAYVRNREGGSGRKYKTIITSVKTKSGNRTIPCNDKAMEALLWFKRYQKEHHISSIYVDCNEKGGILSKNTIPKVLRDILNAAGVEYKSAHSFRHTFATNLIRSGADIKVVSQLLGHSTVKITYDTYVHTGLDSAVEAVNNLNKR